MRSNRTHGVFSAYHRLLIPEPQQENVKSLIHDFLNQKNSTRNLSDREFEELLPKLAEELTQVDYHYDHPEHLLRKDWSRLQKENVYDNFIDSRSRVGMKLCEHFFPNFFEIRSNGKQFTELWKDPNVLEAVIRWNRKSHSTPYLSELRRGVYFTQGLPKSTMYRPLMAKTIVERYNAKSVLDPCAGWGGRMLGTLAAGADYVGFEPNKETHYNLLRLARFIGQEHRVTIICDDFLNVKRHHLSKFDMVLTSPPYWDLEIYDDDPKQSVEQFTNYRDWVKGFIIPAVDHSIDHLKDGGVSCWNVAKVRSRHDLCMEVEHCHEYRNFVVDQTFSVVSSKRQYNQNDKGNLKSHDDTICYRFMKG